MSYDDRISFIQGASYTYIDTVRVSAADPIVLAWFTLKVSASDADPGVLQKKVTTSNVAGTGQITADGSSGGTATIRFDITAADATGLSPQFLLFDVKIKTNSGAFAYGAQGRCQVHRNITTSTS